jgi:hypothetical protein
MGKNIQFKTTTLNCPPVLITTSITLQITIVLQLISKHRDEIENKLNGSLDEIKNKMNGTYNQPTNQEVNIN